jgi:hypothetical protein
VAVFVIGKLWQFNGWPWSDISEIFNNGGLFAGSPTHPSLLCDYLAVPLWPPFLDMYAPVKGSQSVWNRLRLSSCWERLLFLFFSAHSIVRFRRLGVLV